MNNNKGFTFVEILAAVTILGILTVIAIVGVSRILERSHTEFYKNQEKNLILAAQSYMNDNRSELPKVLLIISLIKLILSLSTLLLK